MYQTYYNKKIITAILIVISLALVFLLPWLFSLFNGKSNYYGLYINKPAFNFNLTQTNGKRLNLDDLKGNYLYLMFGFSQCQMTCPKQLGNILSISPEIDEINTRYLFITLDPERDTKDILHQFFESYGKNFIALRSETFQQVQDIAMKFHEYASISGKKDKNNDYDVIHNGYIFLIGPDSRLKLIYTSTQLNHEAMVADYHELKKNQIK